MIYRFAAHHYKLTTTGQDCCSSTVINYRVKRLQEVLREADIHFLISEARKNMAKDLHV